MKKRFTPASSSEIVVHAKVMNRMVILLLSFALGTGNGFAQTIITGGAVSGTWTNVHSPYLVQGGIMIANGATLTIEPGVTVEFQGNYKFLVYGRLLAIGTVTDTITFTDTSTTVGWLGIQFDHTPSSNDTSKIMYCKIQNCKQNVTGGGLFFNNFSKAIISHSRISNNSSVNFGGGIQCSDSSSPIISYNIISHNSSSNGGGIQCNNNSSPVIFNNDISYNSSGYGGGIYCSNSSNPALSHNTIFGNSSSGWAGGIACGFADPDILYNLISNNSSQNSGSGIYCYYSSPSISNNVISNNYTAGDGGGIYLEGDNTSNVLSNTICNNKAVHGGGLYCMISATPTLRNAIVWGNIAISAGNQLYLKDQPCKVDFYYCDVQGGTAAFGLNNNVFYVGTYNNNIDTNPLFVAPSGGSGNGFNGLSADWSLQSSSECINGGDPGGTYPAIDIAGNPRISNGRIDIGAYEFKVVSTGISKNVYQSFIQLYPNPSTGKFIFQNTDDNMSAIEIYNLAGEKIYNRQGLGKRTNIDLSEQPSGIYYAHIKTGEHIVYKKLMLMSR